MSRVGGTLQSDSDKPSMLKYFKRSQSLTDVPVTTDANALSIAQAMVAKLKDPLTRITSLELSTADVNVTAAIFKRDLGDRIRVFRTPPGGGARLDQALWIQQIAIEGDNSGAPWRVSWGVSPV